VKFFRNESSHQSDPLEAFKSQVVGLLIDAAINNANNTIEADKKGSIDDTLNFELLPSYERLRLMKSFQQDLSIRESDSNFEIYNLLFTHSLLSNVYYI
jgi:hypothetical protein